MKVLHVITGLGTGGAETMLYRLMTQQSRSGHEASVVSLKTMGRYGVPIQELGIPTKAMHMRESGLDPVGLYRLARYIRSQKPDIVQTWMYHSDLIGGVIAKTAGVPVVWGIHNSTLHPEDPSRTIAPVRRMCAALSRRLPDAIVSCSETARRIHIEDAGYDGSRMRVIPNGFDLDAFRPDPHARTSVRAELGIPEDAPIIGLIARSDPQKDHRTFFEAASILHQRMPDVHFLLAGWGIVPENPQLQGWISPSGAANRFHLLGSRVDVVRLQASLDIATLTSVSEAFPLVIGEAMSCGVPCVVTDVGDSARIVGETGLVAPPGDPVAIASAWESILSQDEAARAALGRAARQRIADYYSLTEVARRYIDLYEEIAAAHHVPGSTTPSPPSLAPAAGKTQPSPVHTPPGIGSRPTGQMQHAPRLITSSPRTSEHPDGGALVISLDFELFWGLKDLFPPDGGALRNHVLGARTAIPRMLALFDEYQIAATWATVGMLFAHDRTELESFYPEVKPEYDNPKLSNYQYSIGEDEEHDPMHYAPSLIHWIREFERQEIGTHTFSHYYCLEPGQSREAFSADIASAVAIAGRQGIELRSIVFPRNQHNPEFDPTLLRGGITAYRGNRKFWADNGAQSAEYFHPRRRAGRLLDTYIPVGRRNSTEWSDILQSSGLANIPANRFMGPRVHKMETQRIKRVITELEEAAEAGRIYHIWWHPFNFGVDQDVNLGYLKEVLSAFAACRDRFGMQSLSMRDVANTVGAAAPATPTVEEGSPGKVSADRDLARIESVQTGVGHRVLDIGPRIDTPVSIKGASG